MRRRVRRGSSVTGTTRSTKRGDEPVEGAARIRAHRLLDLVEASAAGGDRVEDQTSQVASLSLGRKHQLTLGEELAARRTGETGEVDSQARALIPPFPVERHASHQAPDESSLRGTQRR